jgi:hypothetical protein
MDTAVWTVGEDTISAPLPLMDIWTLKAYGLVPPDTDRDRTTDVTDEQITELL